MFRTLRRNIVSALVCVSLSGLAIIPVAAQSRIPAEATNYLQVTGTTNNGDQDTYNASFFEIPTSVTGPIYVAINSPGANGGAEDSGTGTTWNFYIVGKKNIVSSDVSRQITFASLAEATSSDSSDILQTLAYTTETGWNYSAAIYPSQGEVIGTKSYIKVIARAPTGDGNKNGYQLELSTSNSGTPTGISSARAFAYAWTLNLGDTVGQTWDLYPFVPDSATGNIVQHNFDVDNGEGAILYNKAGTSQGAITLSNDNVEATGAYSVTGQTFGTWRLQITETDGGEPAQNTAVFWFTGSNPAETYRTYSATYTPPSPNRVALTMEDGAGIANNVDVEKVALQIVDASGDPAPTSKNIYVSVDNAGIITASNNNATVNAANTVVTTDGTGTGWIRVKKSDSTSGSVTVSLLTDGNNGSTAFGGGLDDTVIINFQTTPNPTLSSEQNTLFSVLSTQRLGRITVAANGGTQITTANDILIRIPNGVDALFDTTKTALTTNLTNPGTTTITAIDYPTIAPYAAGKVLRINVGTADFGTTTSLAIGTLFSVSGPTTNATIISGTTSSSGSLLLSTDGGTLWSVVDDKVIATIPASTWTGAVSTDWYDNGNWSPSVVPNSTSMNVSIPLTGNQPTISTIGTTNVNNLTLAAGVTVTLSGAVTLAAAGTVTIGMGSTIDLGAGASALSITGTFSNSGTVKTTGAQTITLTAGQDTDSGSWEYTGTTGPYTIADFGATDYYDLRISGAGTFNTGAALTVANDLFLSAGTTSVGHAVTIAGNLSWSGATALNYTAGGITLSGTTKTITPGTATIASPLTVQAGASYTLTANLTSSSNLTVPGSLASGNFNISVTGNIDFSTTGAFTAGIGTVTMAANGVARTLATNGVNFNNLTLSTGTDTTTLSGTGALNVLGTLTLNAGQTLDVGGNNFTIATVVSNATGVLAVDGSQATQTITTNDTAAGTVLYKGTAGGTIGLASFYNLTVDASNDTNQTYTLNGTTAVAGALVINSGTIGLAAFNLTVTGNAQIGDASAGTPQIGSMTQVTGALVVNGTTNIDAGVGNSLSLTTATNNFVGAVTVESVLNLSLADINGFSFAAVASTVSGNLSLTLAGTASLTQGAGALDVTGTLTITTSTASTNVTLTTSTNTLAGAISLAVTGPGSYGTVSIVSDSTTSSLAALAATTTFTLNFSAAGIVIPSAAAVTGTMTLTAGNGTITDAADFSAGTLILTASGAITLNGASNTIGTLGAVSRGGAFTLVDSAGGLTVTGPLTAGTTSNAVTISTAGGVLAVNGNISATTGAGVLSLTGVGVNIAATATGAGGITINGGTGTLTTSGAVTNSATANAITLRSDDFSIGAAITGGSALVRFTTASPGQAIYLGTGATNAGLSSAEINNVTTSGTLTIGDAAHTGTVQTDGTLSISTPTGPVSILTSGGTVTLNNAVTTPGALSIDTTQGAVLTGAVNGTGLLTAAAAGAGTLTVTAGAGINLSNTGNLAASFVLNNQNGSGNIVARANRNTQIAGSNLVPGASFTFVNQTGTLATSAAVATTGGGAANVSLTTVGLMTLSFSVTAGGTGFVSLNSAGVTQSGGVIVSGGGLELAGTGTFALTQSNTNGKIAANITGNLTYTDSGALVIDTVNGNSAFTTGAANNTTITSGDLTQANPITTSVLTLTSTGAITLTSATNAVSTIGAVSRGGAFQFVDNVATLTLTGPLTAGTITNAVSITNTGSIVLGGNVSTSGANNISIGGAGISVSGTPNVNSGSGTILIDGNGGAINLGSSTLTTTNNTAAAITVRDATTVAIGNVSSTGGTTARLTVGIGSDVTGAVTQTGATTMNLGTGGLAWSTNSTVALGNGSSTIPILDASTSNGDSSLTTTGNTSVSGAVNTTNGNLSLNAVAIALAANVDTGTGYLSLTTSGTGGVTQSAGRIAVTGLRLPGSGTGTYAINQTANTMTTFAASTGGGAISITSTGSVAVGTVGGTVGANTGAGSLFITADGITQTAAISTTSGLRIAGTGTFTLTNTSNVLTSFTAAVDGDTSIYSTGAVNFGTVAGGSGVSVGTNELTLNGTGAWAQSASPNNITASGLELLGSGSYTFANTGNAVSVIAGNVTNNVNLGTGSALSIGTVNTVGLSAAGITFNVTGVGLTQTQALVSSGTLAITAGTSTVDLTGSAGNNFASVSIVSAGTLSLTDTNGYAVTGAAASTSIDLTTAAGAITVSGGVSTSGTATQNLHPTGNLQINATISTVNGDVTLNPGGQIFENTATMFGATGTGGLTVSRPLTLQANTNITGAGGDIAFGASATINGTNTFGIAGSTGDISFDAAIGSVTALGAITISSGNDVTTSSTLAAASVSITNAGILTIADTGGAGNTAADWTLTGAFSHNGTGSLAISGDISTSLAAGAGITLNRPVTLAGAVRLTTANSDVSFGSNATIDAATAGTETLTVLAGTGDIAVNTHLGATTALGTLNLSAADILLSGGDLKTNGATQTYTATNMIVLNPSASGTISSGSQTIRFDSPGTFVDDTATTATLTLGDDLLFESAATPASITRHVYLYRGTLTLGANTLTIKGDLVILGAAYNANDLDRAASTTEFRYPQFATMNGKHTFTSPGGTSFGAGGLDGATFEVYGAFYANGPALTAGAPWTLKIHSNDTIGGLVANDGFDDGTTTGRYARIFNTVVNNGLVDAIEGAGLSAIVSASSPSALSGGLSHQFNGSSDGGSNEVPAVASNWQGYWFSTPYILSAETVSDNILKVVFSEALENSNGEIKAAVASNAQSFRFNNGAVKFTKVYRYTNTGTPDINGNGYLDSAELTEVTVTPFDGANQGLGDFGTAADPLFLWVDSGVNSWNTDATGLSAGNAASTDRQGTHRTTVASIDVLKGFFFSARGKNQVPNYGDNSGTAGARFTATTDAAPPVLTGVWAGRSPYNQDHLAMPVTQTNLRQYDGHNFLHFRYSEPLDFNNGAIAATASNGSVQSGIPDNGVTSTVRSSATFGAVNTTAGTVTIAGLLQFPGQIEQGGRTTGDHRGQVALTNLIIRDDSAPTVNPAAALGLTFFLSGYSFTLADPADGGATKRFWPGWVRNPSTAGAGITSPVGQIPTVPLNVGILDGAGNVLEPSSVNLTALSPRVFDTAGTRTIDAALLGTAWASGTAWPKGAGFSVANSTATDDAGGNFYAGWDVDPPVFTRPLPVLTAQSPYDLVTRTDPGTGKLNRMEIHLLDDMSTGTNPGWNRTATRVAPYDFRNPLVGLAVNPFLNDGIAPDGYNDPTTQNRIVSGIRDTSWNFPETGETTSFVVGELAAFKIEDRSVEGVAGSPPRNDLNIGLSSNVDNTEFGGAVDKADDPYFTLSVSTGATNPWGSLSNMYMEYDETIGFVTDHAGNLLRSKTSIYAIERTPPYIELALAIVGKRKIFIQFNEPVFGDQFGTKSLSEIALPFTISGSPAMNVSGLQIIESSPDLPKSTTKAVLTVDRDITANDVYTLKVSVAAGTIYDQSENAMIGALARQISDVGLGTVNPVYAVDDIVNPGVAGHVEPVRVFDGSQTLTGRGTIQLQVQNFASVFLSLPVKLYYDVQVDAADLYNDSFWYPQTIPGLYIPSEEERGLPTQVGANIDARMVLGQAGTNGLTTFRITSGDSEIKDGAMLEFVLEAGGLPTASFTNVEDPSSISPWKLGIGGIVEQRGGVTILNNVINPTVGDKTVLLYDLKRAGQVNVIVFTLDGSIVKVLQRNRMAPGSYTFSWDGTNASGMIVARGLYLIRVVGPDTDEFRKVLVVKP